MADAKHTPGPWRADLSDDDFQLTGADGSPILMSFSDQYGSSSIDCDKADARLIAAAPDMLLALSWLLGLVERPSMASKPDDYEAEMLLARAAARAAIAKATE
jgi:hypothetical protein